MRKYADWKPMGITLLMLIWFPLANAQDARDEAFFGDDEALESQPSSTTTINNTPSLDANSDQVSDMTTIGGQLYLQTDATAFDGQRFAEFGSAQRALLYLYLDQRPSSTTRVFVKGSLLHPMGPDEEQANTSIAFNRPNARIEELWLKVNVNQKLFITAGTQPIRWGVGRIWNPTDFLNQQQRDPLAFFDARPGLSCVKLHVPFESAGSNLYLFVRPGLESRLSDLRYSIRYEQVLGTSEWTLSADTGYESPLKLGGDLSWGVGPLDLRAEVATHSTAPDHRYSGLLDPSAGTIPMRDDKESWAVQWTIGAEWGIAYGDDHTLYLTAEYFRNPLGYANGANLYPWLVLEGAYRPLYLGQDYIGLNVALPGLGDRKDQSVLLSGISNLSDKTHIVRFDYQITVLTRLRLSAFVTTFLGDQGEFRYSFEVPAGLIGPEAINIPAARGTVGLWSAITF